MYHYKDWPPMRTINHIRGIVEDLGIVLTEDRWVNNANRSYSVRLLINGTKIGVNGKGVTAELALASAYGEFMERLQNQCLYSLFTYYQSDTSLQELNGFRSYPDEVYLSVSELLERTDTTILKNIIPRDLESESPDEYVRALSILGLHPETGKLLCIPYYCINSDSLVYLPRSVLTFVYGTNGMCAGNTPEEALVQGLCEIIERYTNKMILFNDVSPPDIPAEYFSHLPQAELLTSLEKNEIIKVLVKDASLGEELPSVCMAVVNRELSAYFVKFASHIEFEVALERTLTELFQGRTIERLEKGDFMVPFTYGLDDFHKSEENLLGIFGTGEGVYNSEFFGNSYSYPLNEDYFNRKDLEGNRAYLCYLVQSLLKKGWQILVRDVSFLGFHAFQIIVPGISELSKLFKKSCVEAERKVRTAHLLKNIKTCTAEELLEIARVTEHELKKEEHGNVADLTGLLYLEGFPWKEINFNLFLCTVYLGIGDFEKSHHYMKKYITEIKEKNIVLAPGGLKYYKCVGDYLALLTKGQDAAKEGLGTLQQIYGEDTVSHVAESIYPERAFHYYQKLNCPSCSDCVFRECCYYDKIREMHTKIKTLMVKNPIDQLDKNRKFWKEVIQ